MKSGSKTTYILLERGIEDVDLVNDIRRVIVDLKIKGLKEALKRYPTLIRFQLELIDEVRAEDPCAENW